MSPTQVAQQSPLRRPAQPHDAEAFAAALDDLRKEVEARLGKVDADHVKRVRSLSTLLELSGRGLVIFSLEPVSFSLGVCALSAHKTLELMELGHSCLHGAYDKVEGADAFAAKTFRWKAPIDEASWKEAHNVRHHQYTNVAERDPDLDFGGLRLSGRIRHRALHRLQPLTNVASWLGFASAINLHSTGMLPVYFGGRSALRARAGDAVEAHRKFLRKAAPYYLRELGLFPLLSGPFFLKTLLGNLLSEIGRDVFAGMIIYCGHVGATDYPEGTRAGSRGRFYVMQVEAAHNLEVSPLVSVLCGGLDHQIEHHLFPRLPPNRLREIAPRVREICEQHGVEYKSTPFWPRVREVFRTLHALREVTAPLISQ